MLASGGDVSGAGESTVGLDEPTQELVMSVFESPDLVPLWDRPPDFMPLRPAGGAYRWSYATVRQELVAISETLAKEASERRVALLAHPGLTDGMATEGLHAGIQLLLAGESAAPHRHTPGALRVGLEATEIVTTIDDQQVPLGPLDVVLNPSGTRHGHVDRGGTGGVWLDVVDLPLVAALGGVLFEPNGQRWAGDLLDPPVGVPSIVRFPWSDVEAALEKTEAVDGVRTHHYGDGSVLPTLAVTAYAVDEGATLRLPARTAGAVSLVGRGRFDLDGKSFSKTCELEPFDVVSLRTWTPAGFTSRGSPGIVMVIDTSPVTKRLGLYREDPTS